MATINKQQLADFAAKCWTQCYTKADLLNKQVYVKARIAGNYSQIYPFLEELSSNINERTEEPGNECHWLFFVSHDIKEIDDELYTFCVAFKDYSRPLLDDELPTEEAEQGIATSCEILRTYTKPLHYSGSTSDSE